MVVYRRAVAEGVDSAALEEAMEGDNPKRAVISLVAEKLG